jgi:hypothetical protein
MKAKRLVTRPLKKLKCDILVSQKEKITNATLLCRYVSAPALIMHTLEAHRGITFRGEFDGLRGWLRDNA